MDASQDVIIDSGNLQAFNTVFPPRTSKGSSATLILHIWKGHGHLEPLPRAYELLVVQWN